MRLLIDECADPRVKGLFQAHEAFTVHEMGWGALKDPELLSLANQFFNVLLTMDRGLEFQQNLKKLSLGLVVVLVRKNQIPYYREIQQELLAAVEQVNAGEVIHVRGPVD